MIHCMCLIDTSWMTVELKTDWVKLTEPQTNLVVNDWRGDLPAHFSLGKVTYENGAVLAQRRNVV